MNIRKTFTSIYLLSILSFNVMSEPLDPLTMNAETKTDIKLEANPFSTAPPQQEIWQKKCFAFTSVSLATGPGFSFRKRQGLKGKTIDVKLGTTLHPAHPFDSKYWFPIPSIEWNSLTYVRETETSPYFSVGVGAAYILPYVSSRAGIEFKNGFIDVGIKSPAFSFSTISDIRGLIIPDIRAGMGWVF